MPPPESREMRSILVTVSAEDGALLDVLGKSIAMGGKGDARAVLQHLAASAADGVRRPGAWERQWVYTAFGDGWEGELEVVPGVPYFRRPKEKP